jgi:hypothetical protein
MTAAPVFVSGQLSYHLPLIRQEKAHNDLLQLNDSTKHKKKNTDGLYIGVNLGFYKANRYTASYYNGSGVNNVDSTINNTYNYPKIKESLIYDFSLAQLPAKMHYSPAFLLGVYFKYAIKNSGIIIQFNIAKLRANDVFTLIIDDPNNFSSEPVYKQESIQGIEQRASIDVGYSYTFNPRSNYRPFLQFGGNLTSTKFLDNKIKIENLQYSITNYRFSYYKLEQGGVGFGAFAGGGMNLIFNESISIMPTLNIYYTHAKMGPLTKPKFNYSFYITAILNGIL